MTSPGLLCLFLCGSAALRELVFGLLVGLTRPLFPFFVGLVCFVVNFLVLFFGFFAGFLGTLIYSAKLLRTDSWRSARRAVWLATAIILTGFLISFISIATIASQHSGFFGPETPVGWQNQFGILSGCAWLMIVSWQAMSLKNLSTENSKEG